MATMDKKARMTLDDVLADLRSRGVALSKTNLCAQLKSGEFPFATLLGTSPTGRSNYLILRKKYESWAEECIGPVLTN